MLVEDPLHSVGGLFMEVAVVAGTIGIPCVELILQKVF